MAKQTREISISNPITSPLFHSYIAAVRMVSEEQTEEAETALWTSWEALVNEYSRPVALAMFWVWQRTLPRQEWFDVDPDCGTSYLDSKNYLTLDGGDEQFLVIVR